MIKEEYQQTLAEVDAVHYTQKERSASASASSSNAYTVLDKILRGREAFWKFSGCFDAMFEVLMKERHSRHHACRHIQMASWDRRRLIGGKWVLNVLD